MGTSPSVKVRPFHVAFSKYEAIPSFTHTGESAAITENMNWWKPSW